MFIFFRVSSFIISRRRGRRFPESDFRDREFFLHVLIKETGQVLGGRVLFLKIRKLVQVVVVEIFQQFPERRTDLLEIADEAFFFQLCPFDKDLHAESMAVEIFARPW